MKSKLDTIAKELENAAEGLIDSKATIPEFLTPQRTMEIIVKAFAAKLRRAYELWQESPQKEDSEAFSRLLRSLDVVKAK